ncbi:hypothetical protein [Pedococcus bigeumensis]|uniref:Uncharacterized protein n=1 Tax=Pedococcus bigeumensis TaxID=433644 RepID=A0A502CLB4_9MICO|nr:hypothetical protein [Pedococcus bigeumensis]TPG12566.1 hypothetical protein EAH86_19875 [Pedococcus bigeumensis]
MTIADRLSSNLKKYRTTPRRGEAITLQEASRQSGISILELRRRIESGELDAWHTLVIDATDLEAETTAHQRQEFARLIEDATGTAPTDDKMVQMFGPKFAAQAVTA